MSKKQIKNILEDIYKIDKSLKTYGSQLEKIVVEILEAKPEVSVDKKFKQELYREIMVRISELEPKKKSIRQGIFSRKFSYAFASVLAIVVVVVVAVIFFTGGEKVSFNLGINDINDSGFGPLVLSDSSSSEAKGGGGPGTSGSAYLPAPGYTEFKYVYIGEDFSIDEDTAGIYKRKVNDSVSRAFSQKISDLKFDFVNFSKFKDLSVDYITISEDRSFGYSINLDLKDASLGLYKNWEKWPKEENVKISDIPSNEKIIAIADAFIEEHDIDMSAYGKGEVSADWNAMLEQVRSDKQSEQVVGQGIRIMYQLLLDNVGVYDEWGNKVGISAEVDIINNKVSNLSNVIAQSYDRSNYVLETNVDRILEIAGKTGALKSAPGQKPAKTVEVHLDTPEKVFLQVLIYNVGRTEPEKLYVPALNFPVVKSEKTGFPDGRKRIIVPLVKEILDQKIINN